MRGAGLFGLGRRGAGGEGFVEGVEGGGVVGEVEEAFAAAHLEGEAVVGGGGGALEVEDASGLLEAAAVVFLVEESLECGFGGEVGGEGGGGEGEDGDGGEEAEVFAGDVFGHGRILHMEMSAFTIAESVAGHNCIGESRGSAQSRGRGRDCVRIQAGRVQSGRM